MLPWFIPKPSDFFPLRQEVWEQEAREICETSRLGIKHGSNYSIWTTCITWLKNMRKHLVNAVFLSSASCVLTLLFNVLLGFIRENDRLWHSQCPLSFFGWGNRQLGRSLQDVDNWVFRVVGGRKYILLLISISLTLAWWSQNLPCFRWLNHIPDVR